MEFEQYMHHRDKLERKEARKQQKYLEKQQKLKYLQLE
jgi:hypothetical protein